jgi:adenosylcobinamide amidohydrolase
VQYYRSTANITSGVKAGTYSSGAIAAGNSVVIRMDVTAAKTSAATATFLVRLASLPGTTSDAVRAIVTAH